MGLPVAESYVVASGGVAAAGRYYVSPFYRDLAPGWTEIATTGIPPGAGVFAFSGMGLDPVAGNIYVFGGGHNDSPDNVVHRLGLESRAWGGDYAPSISTDPPLATAQAMVDNTNYPGAYVVGGVPVRPVSRHTYKSVQWVPEISRLIAGGGSTYGGSGDYLWLGHAGGGAWHNGPNDLWHYNTVAKAWEYRGSSLPNAVQLLSSDYYINRGCMRPGSTEYYSFANDANGYMRAIVTDVATGVVTIKSTVWSEYLAQFSASVFDPAGRYAYILTQADATAPMHLVRYDQQTDTYTRLPVNAGSLPTFQYDEVFHIALSHKTNCLYAISNQAKGLHRYNIATGEWAAFALPDLDYLAQVGGRWAYDHIRNLFFLVYSASYLGVRVMAFKE